MFCGTNKIMWSIPHIQSKYGEYSLILTTNYEIFPMFRLNVEKFCQIEKKYRIFLIYVLDVGNIP